MLSHAEILQKVNNNVPIQLTFKAGKYLLMIATLVLCIAIFIYFSQFFEKTFIPKDSIYWSSVIYFALLSLFFWIFSNAADVRLVGKYLEVKPYFFKSEKRIHINKVVKIKSLRIKQSRYSLVWFTNDFNVEEKFLILQSNSIIFGVQPPLKEVVTLLKEIKN